MDAYKEDTFEKMHGRIRDQLFTQKQGHCHSFCRNGGLEPHPDRWVFSQMEKNGEDMFVLAFLEAL